MPVPILTAGRALLGATNALSGAVSASTRTTKGLKVDLTFLGDDELAKDMAQLEPKIQRKVLRQAFRAEAKEIAKIAKSLVPVETGELKKSIKVRAMKRSRVRVGYVVMAGIGIDPDKRNKAMAVEFGTKDRAATPYLRPAHDQRKDRALKNIADELGKRIDKEMKK